MADLFRNKYRIDSARLQDWDYGWNATYFVTICTKDHFPFFGDIFNGEMILSALGQLANKFWAEIPNHFPFIKLDAFIVMPNHVHGILIFDKPTVETRHRLVSTIPDPTTPEHETLGQTRFHHPQKHTLSSILGSYKSVVTKHA